MSLWHIIKLELARTQEYPNGSPGRSYLIRLPLVAGGLIDEAARAGDNARATVRRFWPNEPDQSGYVLKSKNGWVFSYAVGEVDDENFCQLENHPIRVGEYLTLTEADGTRNPFHVVRAEPA